jgi:hypothetical protein
MTTPQEPEHECAAEDREPSWWCENCGEEDGDCRCGRNRRMVLS